MCFNKTSNQSKLPILELRSYRTLATPGPWQIGDFARAKDTLSVIIVEIDTRIYKTYPELDLTIVPQLSERYYEFNL